jgi:hypothetical protein
LRVCVSMIVRTELVEVEIASSIHLPSLPLAVTAGL